MPLLSFSPESHSFALCLADSGSADSLLALFYPIIAPNVQECDATDDAMKYKSWYQK
jgi:hypothetical protein